MPIEHAKRWLETLLLFGFLLFPAQALATDSSMPTLGGVRLEFMLFAVTLLGVALLHHYTMWVSLVGLTAILTSSPTFALCVSGGGFPLLGDSCSRSTWFLLHRAA